MANYIAAHFDDIEAVRCPCGFARRAFTLPGNDAATVHIVDIRQDARVHYHKEHTEIYLVLEGEGHLELDGELVPVRPFSTVLIRPGCRHRAVGKLRVVNICLPPFDPADEWFD
jgi:mannose-6-phosphate isomerase-like protein (cupin superfamily)